MSKVDELYKIAEPVVTENDCYIYDIEYKKEGNDYFLRLFIDSDVEGGVNIEHCENVSRSFEKLLDEKDLIKEAYILEVSSPGIERKLTKDWHFEKAIGKEIEISLWKAVDGSKTIIGKLIAANGGILTIENENGETQIIEKGKASGIKMHFRF